MTGQPRPPVRRRWKRRILAVMGVGAVAAGVVGVATGCALWYLTTEAGNEWLRGMIERLVTERVMAEGSLTVGHLRTNFLTYATITDVRLKDGAGRDAIVVPHLAIRTSLVHPIAGIAANLIPGVKKIAPDYELEHVDLDGLMVDIEGDASGQTNLGRMFASSEPKTESQPWSGIGFDLHLDDVAVHGGRVRQRDPKSEVRLTGIEALGTLSVEGPLVTGEPLALAAVLEKPYAFPISGAGRIAWDGETASVGKFEVDFPNSRAILDGRVAKLSSTGDVSVDVDLDRLTLATLQTFTGPIGLQGVIEGPIRVRGPMNALAVDATIAGRDGTRGNIDLDLTIDAKKADIPWSATIRLGALHVEDLMSTVPPELAVDGTLVASGWGTKWPDGVHAKGRFDGGRQMVPGNVEIEDLHTDLLLENGVLTFERANVATAFARAGGGGKLDLVHGDLTVDAAGTVILDGLTKLEIPDLYGSGPFDLHLWGNVFAKELPLDATGHAGVDRFAYTDQVKFGRVDADYHWKMRHNDMKVDADVLARTGDAYGTTVGSVTIPDLVADLPANKNKYVSGTAHAETLAYPNAFVADVADGPFTYDERVGAPKIVTANLAIGKHALGLDNLGKLPATGGTVDVRMVDDDVEVVANLRDGDRESLHTVANVNLTRFEGTLTDLRYSPVPRQQWTAVDVQRFKIVDGNLVDGHFDLDSGPFGRVRFDGDVGVTGALDGVLTTRSLQLEAFAELFPDVMGGMSGAVDLDVRLKGRADRPDLTGRIAAWDMWLPGVSRWLDVAGPFTADRDGLDFQNTAIGAADQPLAVLTGHVPLEFDFSDPKLDPEGQLDLDAVLTPGPIERLQWLTETDLGLPEGGRVSATVKLRGKLEDPDLDLYGVTEMPVAQWQSASRIETIVHRKARDIVLGGTVSEGFVSRVTLDGTGITEIGAVLAARLGSGPAVDDNDYALYLDDVDLRLAMHDTPAQSLLAAAGRRERVGGRITGAAHIVGDPYRPVVTSNVDWTDAAIGGLRIPVVHLGLEPVPHAGWNLVAYALFAPPVTEPAPPPPPPEEGEEGPTNDPIPAVDAAVAKKDEAAPDPDAVDKLPSGPKLVVSGKVPLSLDFTREQQDWVVGDLDLDIVSEEVPLEILKAGTFVGGPAITETTGNIDVSGHVGGTPFEPHPDVTVKVEDGSFEVEDYAVRWNELGMDLVINKEVVDLARFHAHTEALRKGLEVSRGASTIDVLAKILMKDWTPEGVGGRVKLDRALLSAKPKQLVRASTDQAISGQVSDKIHIKGDVKIDEANYEYDPAQFASAQYAVDEHVRIHRDGSEAVAENVVIDEAAGPSMFEILDVDAAIDLGRDTNILLALPVFEDFGQLAADLTRADVDVRLGSRDLRFRLVNGKQLLQGDVEVLDGRTKILRSQLDTTGRISFLGDPYVPNLDLNAHMDVRDGSVDVDIKGTPDHPQLSFRSEEYPDQTQIFTILLTGESPERLASGSGAGSAAAGLLLNKALGGFAGDSISIAPDGTLTIGVPNLIPKVRTQVAIDPSPSTGENRYSVKAELDVIPQSVLEGVWGDEHSWADIYWELRF